MSTYYSAIDDQLLLGEVKDMMRNPTFKGIYHHKTRELKAMAAEEIAALGVSPAHPKPVEPGIIPTAVEFRLCRIGESTWVPVIEGIEERSPYSLLPESVIYYIVARAHQDVIAMEQRVFFKELSQFVYVMSFRKEDEETISGTIETTSDTRGAELVDIASVKVPDRVERVSRLLKYLYTHESFFAYTLNEFELKWKPLLDGDKEEGGN